MEKEFLKDLDKFVKSTWENFFDLIENKFKFVTIDLIVDVDDEFNNKYNLKDISFVLHVKSYNNEGSMKYYYKGSEIKPKCYYIRPDNYNSVLTLEILQESIKQDTNEPDIKHIENKNNI